MKITLLIQIILLYILTGCSILEIKTSEDYDVSALDLIGKDFYSLDETLKDGTITTRIRFNNDENWTFQIYEDEYQIYADTNVFLQTHTIPGYIERLINLDDYQIIEFYIDNWVAPGWKTYRIDRYYFGDYDCIMLIEVAEQMIKVGEYEWVDMWHADTTFLYELE